MIMNAQWWLWSWNVKVKCMLNTEGVTGLARAAWHRAVPCSSWAKIAGFGPGQRATGCMDIYICHWTFAWYFLTYAFLIHYSILIKANSLLNSSCSWKASHYWDQSKIINFSCLICQLPNMLAFSWYYDIPQHRCHFIDSICIVVLFLELDYFYDLLTQQYTTLALIWMLWNIIKFTFLLNL